MVSNCPIDKKSKSPTPCQHRIKATFLDQNYNKPAFIPSILLQLVKIEQAGKVRGTRIIETSYKIESVPIKCYQIFFGKCNK